MIEHLIVEVNGARLHLARTGRGRPLLLHGCPEFWLIWEPVMTRLADRFELIAPDLRGFGASDKPVGDFGPKEQSDDMAALIEALEIGPVGIVAPDIGGAIAQTFAQPDRSPGCSSSTSSTPVSVLASQPPIDLNRFGICSSTRPTWHPH